MASLSDEVVQNAYVDYLLDIHRHWNSFGQGHRKAQLENSMRAIIRRCGLPEPSIRWEANGGSFDWTKWAIVADTGGLASDPQVKGDKAWLNDVIYLYHETRHLEQFWRMALGMMSGAVAIPTGPRGRGVMPATASVNARGNHLNKELSYPQLILLKADREKRSFQQGWIPQTRAWVDSVFGRGGHARGQTLRHLRHLGHRSMNPYIHLPEEADAWAVEREVRRKFRSKLGARLGDEALEGLAGLFE